jgi:D-alanyl-D-alanine carboxypeptidase
MCLCALLLVQPAAAQDDPELAAVLQAYVDAHLTGSPAVVVQVSSGGELFGAATGTADGSRPARLTDGFRIASMSKTFVAATALLMEQDGLFSLDDPARDYLPDALIGRIANLDGEDGATLRHLLAMQSGIDDYLENPAFWERVQAEPTFAWTAEAALEYAYDLEPLFTPGESAAYSNTNYLLMQLAMEQAGGAPLHTLIRSYILEPLSLTRTYTQAFETPPAEAALVTGYFDVDSDGTPDDVSGINDGFGLGDGGLVSTAGDMIAFYRALFIDQTLLPEDALAAMLDFAPLEDFEYGLGITRFEMRAEEMIGHGGGVLGFLSVTLTVPDDELIIVVLCATEQCDPDELAAAAAAVFAE